MRDHDDRHPQRTIESENHLHDFSSGAAVEVSGRLIGQQELGLIHQRSRQRCALLLAAGELTGPMRKASAKAYAVKRLPGQAGTLCPLDFSKAHGKLDIFFESHGRNEIEGLKDHSYFAQAILGKV